MLNVPLVILAGGLGTRLREETEFRPKPMVEIGGVPIIWHIMKYYSTWGVNEFIICTGYKGEAIKNYFLNYGANHSDVTLKIGINPSYVIHQKPLEDWKVTVIDTGSLTPTGGRLLKIKDYIQTSYFFCTYGDGVANVDISKLTELHLNSNATATVTAVKPMSRFGVLEIGENGNVKKFREKPRLDTWVNGGYFAFNCEIFNSLTLETVLEQEPLINLSQEGKLSAYKHDGFWQPMDTLREAQFLNTLWDRDEAEWKTW